MPPLKKFRHASRAANWLTFLPIQIQMGVATLIASGFSLQMRSVAKMVGGLLRRPEGVIFAAEHLERLIREQSQSRNFSLRRFLLVIKESGKIIISSFPQPAFLQAFEGYALQ